MHYIFGLTLLFYVVLAVFPPYLNECVKWGKTFDGVDMRIRNITLHILANEIAPQEMWADLSYYLFNEFILGNLRFALAVHDIGMIVAPVLIFIIYGR